VGPLIRDALAMMSARGLNCIFVDVVLVQIGVGVVLVVVVEELSGYLSVDLGLLMLAAVEHGFGASDLIVRAHHRTCVPFLPPHFSSSTSLGISRLPHSVLTIS
jgi:hypothetical protein